MQIVIDIPKEKYDLCKRWKPSERSELQEAVANGIPLPKYHGRLIDESKITKCEQVGLIIKDGNITHCLKTDAPTIIKADN